MSLEPGVAAEVGDDARQEDQQRGAEQRAGRLPSPPSTIAVSRARVSVEGEAARGGQPDHERQDRAGQAGRGGADHERRAPAHGPG